ncbi:putative deoxycytidylate deaminase, partial [Trichinella spiralis]
VSKIRAAITHALITLKYYNASAFITGSQQFTIMIKFNA